MTDSTTPFLEHTGDDDGLTPGLDSQLDSSPMTALLANLTDEQKTAIIAAAFKTMDAHEEPEDDAELTTEATEESPSPVIPPRVKYAEKDRKRKDKSKRRKQARRPVEDDVPLLDGFDVDETHPMDLIDNSYEDDDPTDAGDDLDGLEPFDAMDDSEDTVLVDNGDSGAVKLMDSIVTYETDRFINPKTDRPYNRARLRKEPPVLKFRQHRSGTSEDEDEMVSIILTRPIAVRLEALMRDVVRGYDGVPLEERDKEPFSWGKVKKDFRDFVRYKTAQFVAIVIIGLVLLALAVYGMVISM